GFGRKRAPRDHPSMGEGELPERSSRTLFQLFLFGAKLFLGFALITASVGALAWGVYRYAQTTPRFSIVNIELEGTKRLKRVDVLSTSGLQLGDNLFAMDTNQAENALLVSPWIASARVTRQLPGTVTVSLKEREARAIAVIKGENFLVSAEGIPFKRLGQGDPHDLPLITGTSADELARDRRAGIARVADSLRLLQEYAGSSLAQKHPAEEVHLDRSGRASLVVGTAGMTLHLGVGPWKKKLLRAERVIATARRSGGNPSVLFVDNEAHPERVVVRVR